MKRIFTLITLVLGIATNLMSQSGYEIKFHVKGLKDGGKVQFAYYQGDKKLLQDTVFVENNKFVVKGDKALQRGLYLVALPGHGFFDLIINEDQFFEVESDTLKMIEETKFIGNEENKFFYDYLKKVKPIQDEILAQSDTYTADSCNKTENKENATCKKLYTEITTLQNKLDDIKKQYVLEHPTFLSSKMFRSMDEIETPMFKEEVSLTETERNKKRFDYYKTHYFDNIDFSENGLIRTPILEGKVEKYFKDLVFVQCDSSKIAADYVISKAKDPIMFKYLLTTITTRYEKSNVMCLDCMSMYLFDKYYIKDSLKVDWVSKETRKKLQEEVYKLEYNQCGKKVYPMAKKDTNGIVHDIYKIDAEYTIVYFWSATCGHCKKTTPKLQEMYKRLHEQYDVEVFSVHIDKNRTDFDKFVKEHQLEFIVTIDDGKDDNYRTAYNVFSTPTIYLLNRKKEIIAKKVDIDILEKIITGKESGVNDDSIH